jgi:diguanylate cyclase (GGDEF)-like protein
VRPVGAAGSASAAGSAVAVGRPGLAGPSGDLTPRRLLVLASPVLPMLVGPLALALMPGRLTTVVRAGCWAVAVLGAAMLAVQLLLLHRTASRRAAELYRAIGQRDALQYELRQRATHDPLTGLANRTLLGERLDAVLATDDLPGGSLVLLLLDLDGLAAVNDTLGHSVGDQVLVDTARRLGTVVPAALLIARTSGDEFAVLCDEPADRAMEVAEAVLRAVRRPYPVSGRDVYLTASLGLLHLTGLAGAADALRDADLARSAAKEAGGDRAVVFHAGLRAARVLRSDLADGLRRALAEGSMGVHYQPVVDLQDGRMVAVEALARWTGPDDQQVPPVQFIPVAEETGLIVPLGRWVLRQACVDAVRWHERYGIAVTVNVSGRQLAESDFVDTVLDTLRDTGLPAGALILELTESTLVSHVDATKSLDLLRQHGVRVALDDFGTGYSSLSYLAELPVDILKIDRAFTAPGPHPLPRDWAFTRAILDLARSLNLLAIAEGVETRQQARTLRQLACPFAQGFLYSRPVPGAAIEPMLAEWNAVGATELEPEPAGRPAVALG